MRTLESAARAALMTAVLFLCLQQGVARGEEAWRTGFEEACAQSNQAMTLSVQDLNALVEKCDALEKVIGTQEASVRKVYLKRLQMCRNLYLYVLDYKKNQQHDK